MVIGGLTLITFVVLVVLVMGATSAIMSVDWKSLVNSDHRRKLQVEKSIRDIRAKQKKLPSTHPYQDTLKVYEDLFAREFWLLEQKKTSKELREHQRELDKQLGIKGD